MKKRRQLENEVSKSFDTLKKFLDGPMTDLHEYLPSDPVFRERTFRLHQLVCKLATATDTLHFVIARNLTMAVEDCIRICIAEMESLTS